MQNQCWMLVAQAASTGEPRTSEGTSARSEIAGVATPSEALAVVEFWRSAGKELWFAKNADFDAHFRESFLTLHERAVEGKLDDWLGTPLGALALLILLDQFPRNAFRGTPRMYASDEKARAVADAAVRAGHDRLVSSELAVFMYLPFGHSEDLADQERARELVRRLGEPQVSHAERHAGIVRRFGRFPHRNTILGRVTTAEEQRFLDEGGYAG